MCRCQVADMTSGTRQATVSGPIGSLCESPPRLLALPDLDDPDAFVRPAGCVEDQPFGERLLEIGGEPLVALPARCHVLDECVRHASKVDDAGLVSV